MGAMKRIDDEMCDMAHEYHEKLVKNGVPCEIAQELTQEWGAVYFERNMRRATDRVRGLIIWDMVGVQDAINQEFDAMIHMCHEAEFGENILRR